MRGKKYGALGWNILTLNETDLAICDAQLQLYLNMYDEVPYSVLNLLTSFINYGGRVTDDKDLRTIDIILKAYYRPEVLKQTATSSVQVTYVTPKIEDEERPLDSYNAYINSLPIQPDPEVFSMHKNADITFAENETYEMMDAILNLSAKTGVTVVHPGRTRFWLLREASRRGCRCQMRAPWRRMRRI